MARKTYDEQRADDARRQRRSRAIRAGLPVPIESTPEERAASADVGELVAGALDGELDHAWVLRQLSVLAVDPKLPGVARVSALKAIDDLLPPEVSDEEESGDPTPADARALILQYFGDDITPPAPSPEVDDMVDTFPGADLAGAPAP